MPGSHRLTMQNLQPFLNGGSTRYKYCLEFIRLKSLYKYRYVAIVNVREYQVQYLSQCYDVRDHQSHWMRFLHFRDASGAGLVVGSLRGTQNLTSQIVMSPSSMHHHNEPSASSSEHAHTVPSGDETLTRQDFFSSVPWFNTLRWLNWVAWIELDLASSTHQQFPWKITTTTTTWWFTKRTPEHLMHFWTKPTNQKMAFSGSIG